MTEDKRRAIEYKYVSHDITPTPNFAMELYKLRNDSGTLSIPIVEGVLWDCLYKAQVNLKNARDEARKSLKDYMSLKNDLKSGKASWKDEHTRIEYKQLKYKWTLNSQKVRDTKERFVLESKRYNYFLEWHFTTNKYISDLENKIYALEAAGLKAQKFTKDEMINSLSVMSTTTECELLLKHFDAMYHWTKAYYWPHEGVFTLNEDPDKEFIAKCQIEGIRFNGNEWASKLSQEEIDNPLIKNF